MRVLAADRRGGAARPACRPSSRSTPWRWRSGRVNQQVIPPRDVSMGRSDHSDAGSHCGLIRYVATPLLISEVFHGTTSAAGGSSSATGDDRSPRFGDAARAVRAPSAAIAPGQGTETRRWRSARRRRRGALVPSRWRRADAEPVEPTAAICRSPSVRRLRRLTRTARASVDRPGGQAGSRTSPASCGVTPRPRR